MTDFFFQTKYLNIIYNNISYSHHKESCYETMERKTSKIFELKPSHFSKSKTHPLSTGSFPSQNCPKVKYKCSHLPARRIFAFVWPLWRRVRETSKKVWLNGKTFSMGIWIDMMISMLSLIMTPMMSIRPWIWSRWDTLFFLYNNNIIIIRNTPARLITASMQGQ